MDGLLSLLIFAVFFYVMMRFGCGAHRVHGNQKGHQSKGTSDKHVDPVCGMDVDPTEGYGKMQAGTLYRFCSRECLETFDVEPSRYTSKQPEVPT